MVKKNRVYTESVLQMEAVECGAASLSMILRHFGRYMPLEKIRGDCDVSRDGSKAANILRAARLHGLEAKGLKMEVDNLLDVTMPVIIHWNFNHFLIFEGSDQDWFYLNDPESGHRQVTHEEFSSSFTGIVLTFTPSATFEKTKIPNPLIEGLKERISPHKEAILFTLLTGFALIIPGLIIPSFSKIFVDNILIQGSKDWLWPLIGGMTLTYLLRFGLEKLKYYYLIKTNSKIDITTAVNFFWHVLSLPINFFTQRHPGEISSRIGVNGRVASFISGRLGNNILDVFKIFFFALIMCLYDPALTLLGVCLAGADILILKYFSRRRKEGYIRYAKDAGVLTGVTMAGLQTIETLKATGRENDFFVRWAGQFAKVMNSQQELSVITMATGALPKIIHLLINVSILILGSYKVMNGQLTMGMLVAFQSLMASFLAAVSGLMGLVTSLQEMEGDMTRLDDIMKTEGDKYVVKARKKKQKDYSQLGQKLEGYIDFKNVIFGYSKFSDPLIENFSLAVKPGQRIALVGGSGSGKSTLAKMLAGLFSPTSGKILLDGVPYDKWERQIVNNSIAMVDQDIFLFEGSIRDVLTFWDKNIPEQQIIKACKDAEIHDIISSKKEGYDFVIREGGTNFSGGQRQRLEIARALIGNPSVLILDEATSALDPPTEKLVYDNIKKRKCTVIIVAHRLSTIRDSDEIIMLDYGKITERGTHAELVKSKGKYYELIKM